MHWSDVSITTEMDSDNQTQEGIDNGVLSLKLALRKVFTGLTLLEVFTGKCVALMGTLNNQSSAHLLRYSQKFILRQSEERDVEISCMAEANFLLCLKYERNTRLFKVPLLVEFSVEQHKL